MVYIIALSVLFVVQLYININLFRKNEQMELELQKLSNVESDMVNTLTMITERHVQALLDLKRIDRLGSFESDDEVGFVFKMIKETVEDLKDATEYVTDLMGVEEKSEEQA